MEFTLSDEQKRKIEMEEAARIAEEKYRDKCDADRVQIQLSRKFQNWINGHEASVFYSTPGKVTTGQIDVTLLPDNTCWRFSNRFSLRNRQGCFCGDQYDL